MQICKSAKDSEAEEDDDDVTFYFYDAVLRQQVRQNLFRTTRVNTLRFGGGGGGGMFGGTSLALCSVDTI